MSALGTDLERLVKFTSPECMQEIHDKIACAQFVGAISNDFIKRTLQLEGITSLKAAVERVKVIEQIQEFSFKKKENYK